MAKVCVFSFLFVRLTFFSLIIRDSHCRQCCFLCLRMFLKVISLMLLAKVSLREVSHLLFKLMSIKNIKHVWMLQAETVVQKAWILSPGNLQWNRCWVGLLFFPYSMSSVNSVFSRPNVWINQMSNKLFSCSEFSGFCTLV